MVGLDGCLVILFPPIPILMGGFVVYDFGKLVFEKGEIAQKILFIVSLVVSVIVFPLGLVVLYIIGVGAGWRIIPDPSRWKL